MNPALNAAEQQKEPLMNATEAPGESLRVIREWKSWKIEPAFTGFMSLLGVLMVTAIISLTVISHKETGFITIVAQHEPNNDSIFGRYVFDTGLLWTTLPSLIMTFYNLAWGCIATAAIDRQPFVDLSMKKEVAATRSIALDYRTKVLGQNCIVALKNQHYLISGLMSIALAMSVIAAAAARLFVLRSVVSVDSTNLALTSAFNLSGLTASTNLRSSLDLVLATRIYDASPPPWTDGEYAFPSISLPSSSNNFNLTVDVDAKAAYLDCAIVDSTRYTTTLQHSTDPPFSNLRVAFLDRDCSIETNVTIQATTSTYLHTFSELSCASGGGNRRFGLVSGTYSASSPTLLRNISVISCIPKYWTIPGQLVLSKVASKMAPLIDSFTRDTSGATQFMSGSLALFENGLDINIALDTTNAISTTEFGRALLQLAQSRSATPLDPTVLQDAMSEVFTSAFAMLSRTVLYTMLVDGARPTVKVEREIIVQRLLVYPPVAVLLCIVLALSVLCTVWTGVYSSTHRSILHEEPSGLLSYADILSGSGSIENLVRQLRAQPEYDGRIIHCGNKTLQLDNVKCSTSGEGQDRKIDCVTELKPEVEAKSLRWIRLSSWSSKIVS